ncbi:MAG: glucose 1-dehydrogenase [Arachidicoccus sp.]|nr:glucose 1-dehydrogenase [Arachidicoccus sp.]
MKKLQDKIVIVTGAAQGMGKAIAIEAAKNGAAWITVADIQGKGQETADEIIKHGTKAMFIKTDLSSSKSIKNMIETTAKEAGGIDVLVNNAGITDDGITKRAPSIMDLPEDVWDKIMSINLKAMWLCSKYAAPYLSKSKKGPAIVNAASTSSYFAYTGLPAYSTSKGGVVSLTRQIALDLGEAGVRCNAYAPGAIDTPMLAASAENADDLAEAQKRLWGPHIIKRLGRPEEVADLVCFLASDQSSFITGAIIPIDAGTIAWRGIH